MTTTSNTKTLTATSTVDALIGGYRSHVLGRPLPNPAAVHFDTYGPEVSVQPNGGPDTLPHLSNILVWACSLDDATAEWWRTDDDRLHVTVRGRTGGGTRIKVYGGCAFVECLGLVALESGQSEGVSLDELYAFVGLLREEQEQRKGAA